MKISYSTNMTEPMSWIENIKFAEEHGFDGIMFCNILPKDVNINELAKKLKGKGLEIGWHAPVVSVDIGALHEEIRKTSVELLKNDMINAKKINTQSFDFHLNYRPFYNWNDTEIKLSIKNKFEKVAWKNSIKSIKEIIKFSKQVGVFPCLENSGNLKTFASTKKEFEILAKEIPDLKFCFDTGHAFLNGFTNQDLNDFIKKYKDRILSIHLNDNKGDKDSHIAIGTGFIDFEEIFRTLKKIQYRHPLVIETHLGDVEGLIKSIKYIKKLEKNN